MRIIPARAGFTEIVEALCPDATDHPRSRGVYGDRTTVTDHPLGSSPLARGLRWRWSCHILLIGIIPARAGFTTCRTRRSARRPDHPRSRGVYADKMGNGKGRSGSSPLARGLRMVCVRVLCTCGIIPARAGFTVLAYGYDNRVTDHPRSRGVYVLRPVGGLGRLGSSPLTRGLRQEHVGLADRDRIIPARAGFTSCGLPFREDGADHPRSRGVYMIGVPFCPFDNGSSPLARGLRMRMNP